MAKLEHHQQRNNKVTRRRIQTLQRRRDHLKAKPGSEKSAQFDDAELAALDWAIPILQDWIRTDPWWVRLSSGKWRHVNWPFYDRNQKKWLVQVSADERRDATEEEIAQVKQGDEIWE